MKRTVTLRYIESRFADDIELMTGSRPHLYWLICWKYLSPLAMLCILVASIVQIVVDGSGYAAWVADKGVTERHEWPVWALVLIAVLILVSVLWIPVVCIARYGRFQRLERYCGGGIRWVQRGTPTWQTWRPAVCSSVTTLSGLDRFRMFDLHVIEDSEKAWFPAADLREFHGIVPHEVTTAETLLFCIREDGSEGLCCPTGGAASSDEEDDDA